MSISFDRFFFFFKIYFNTFRRNQAVEMLSELANIIFIVTVPEKYIHIEKRYICPWYPKQSQFFGKVLSNSQILISYDHHQFKWSEFVKINFIYVQGTHQSIIFAYNYQATKNHEQNLISRCKFNFFPVSKLIEPS